MITLVNVKSNDHGGSGWMISGRLDRRRPNGCFRRNLAVGGCIGEGPEFDPLRSFSDAGRNRRALETAVTGSPGRESPRATHCCS